MSSERNLYCSRLNLPVPRVEDRVGAPNVKLFHLLVVALLEQGEPMTLEAIAQRLTAAGVRPPTGDMLLSLRKAWHGNQPVYRDAQGRMCLDVQSPRLGSLLFSLGIDRTASPDPAEPAVQPPELELPPDDVPLNESEVQAAWAAQTDSLSTVRIMLAVLDQRVRQVLSALCIADTDCFRLADLKPPQKSRRLNRQGRTLSITLDLLITSTTGISRPLGDAKVASYLAQGQLGKLRRRLEADVKALYAFYHYGVLHRCVRLRWGFLDELLLAQWAQKGDETLYEILSRCEKEATPVEMVWGSAPGWSEPWSRARRVTVRIMDAGTIEVNDGLEPQYVWRYDVQAVRVAEDREATGKQPVEP